MKWMPLITSALACLAFAPSAGAQNGVPAGAEKPRIPGQNLAGMRIYLRAGLKTHAVGEHDYPQFLADWSKLLTERGAVVDGSLHAPTAEELKDVDVVVMYKGDAGFMTPSEKAALDAYVKRGGGIVTLHDPLCGPDPAQFASYVGGGKRHGEVNYTLGTDMTYTIADRASPIMKGMTDLTIYDEAFYKLTWANSPQIHVLATTKIPDTPAARRGGGVGEVVPQIWTYEHIVPGGKPARSFVWMQGHTYTNLSNPQLQAMLLRGIAWAAKRPVDELVNYTPPPPRARS
jgi:type 1 glutamine amidotransferase